jgi:nitroimidazol reductase NimA-like FMN-containing flavoprotein (pyridoxamine 5'-phosphate oxidase superfamily)
MFEHLTQRECVERLSTGRVGRVGLVLDGVPHVLPVNYTCDATGLVVFRTQDGTVLATIDRKAVVFEIDGFDASRAMGWSVCVHGTGREVFLPQAEAAQALSEQSLITWAPGPRDRWFSIVPDELTGRRVELSGDGCADGWIRGVVS